MSQLRASSKNSRLSCYFANPSSTYDKFVNKPWIERTDVFESKQNFIERTVREWDTLDEIQRNEFLCAPSPELRRNSIKISLHLCLNLKNHLNQVLHNLMNRILREKTIVRDTNHISLPPPSSIEPQPCTINSHSAVFEF